MFRVLRVFGVVCVCVRVFFSSSWIFGFRVFRVGVFRVCFFGV